MEKSNQQSFTVDQERLLWLAAFTLNVNDFNILQGYAFEKDYDPAEDLSLQKCIKVKDKFEVSLLASIEERVVGKLNEVLCRMQSSFQVHSLPVLEKMNLSGTEVLGVVLAKRIFHLPVDFTGTKFNGSCNFSKTYFRFNTDFVNCEFTEKPNFSESVFLKTIKFDGAVFNSGANFASTVSKHKISFNNSKFGGQEAFFELASYHSASFSNAVFNCKARLRCSSFIDLSCKNTIFNELVSFQSSSFIHNADFSKAKFNGMAKFDLLSQSQIRSYLSKLVQHKSTPEQNNFIEIRSLGLGKTSARIDFSGCTFKNKFIFNSRVLSDYVTFIAAHFYTVPRFYKVENVENLDFTNCNVDYPYCKADGRPLVNLMACLFRLNTDITVINDIRNLRRIASDTKHHDLSKNLFLLERCAEIGCLYNTEKSFYRWVKTFFSKNFLLYGVYLYSSNGGRSVVLPMFWMLISWFLFSFSYLLVAKTSLTYISFKNAAIYSYANIIPFVSKTNWAKNLESKLFVGQKIITVPDSIYIISSVEHVIGIILIFLLGLTIRNHFKIN